MERMVAGAGHPLAPAAFPEKGLLQRPELPV